MSNWEEKNYSGIETYVKAKLTELKARAEKYRIIPPEEQYFTIEVISDNTELSWLFPSDADESFKATIEFSYDNGLTWNSVTAGVGMEGNIGTYAPGDIILLRGTGPTGFYDEEELGEAAGNFLYADKPCFVYGNVMSLLYGANFAGQKKITQEYAFAYLFSDYDTEYTGEWLRSKAGSPLVLPATTLAAACYYSMLSRCSSLTTAPELPATTLADDCYGTMFGGCTALATAPELPATTLANFCYATMFQGCTSLAAAPELPATTLAERCYNSMFSGCTSLTIAPALPATTLADYCYATMFFGCTSLATAPELPATTLAKSCYSNMFVGCTSLTTAPELPATTLADYCYNSMFSGCTSLTTAPELPVTTLAERCYSSMFRDCTSLTTAPELPATTLTDFCYDGMFYGCTSLASVKCLASAVSPSSAVNTWLRNVSATGTFTKAAGVSWPTGSSGIPSGWTVQTASE